MDKLSPRSFCMTIKNKVKSRPCTDFIMFWLYVVQGNAFGAQWAKKKKKVKLISRKKNKIMQYLVYFLREIDLTEKITFLDISPLCVCVVLLLYICQRFLVPQQQLKFNCYQVHQNYAKIHNTTIIAISCGTIISKSLY